MTLEHLRTSLMTPGTTFWTDTSVPVSNALRTAGRRTRVRRIRKMRMLVARTHSLGLVTTQARSVVFQSSAAAGQGSDARIPRVSTPCITGMVLAGRTEAHSQKDARKEPGWQRTPSHSS